MQELIDAFADIGTLLGFAGAGIAYAYIGSLLASLLCVFYGLLLWNPGQPVRRVRSSRRGGTVKKGRGLRWRHWR
ncbi:MAG: hypothetical protein A2Z08_02320 [Deltaproteobacteria bacterium RBG_16_54_11]|jgi:hypothetical protein|nr:MAG: hypothetical protein A2Z08_02320 [Deltaproteobacteria bacterium RBG_16_54_11]